MGFRQVPRTVEYPALEERILAFWRDTQAFDKLVAKNKGGPRWSFMDGPITANNPMGVHHAWGRTYKDTFQRYRAMRGFDQRYQNGFDCQGLWIEVEVERELGFKSKRDIEAYGIAEFVERCKERVYKYAGIQTEQSIRLGYWMHWDNSYYTLSDENNYNIWHFLKRCHERGLVYKGNDSMPWCPRCGTGISQHEIATEGYQELEHPGVFAEFPLRERPGEALLVWTTTAWTLTANVAAAVHPELPYLRVRQGERVLYISKGTAARALQGDYEVLGEVPGRELVGLTYLGPFDELPAVLDSGLRRNGAVWHPIIAWEEVSETEGTGIVHIAPGCGKEDMELGREHGLPPIVPLDEFGNYVEGFDWLSGRNVYAVAEPIIESLGRKGRLYHVEPYTHRYPVCWRCSSELVFRLVDEWFISMDGPRRPVTDHWPLATDQVPTTRLRDEIADVTKQITWLPPWGLERELDWLRNMDDWMISKKRYYGLALPIWTCESCGWFDVIGSPEELHERAVEGWDKFEGHSPHRPWIDAVKVRCGQCGATASRIADVGNPWLDAGIVPYSTLDYRTNRAYWSQWFPAHFITESFPGQFRNWFYVLLTMSTVLEHKPPFRTVLGHAQVRDEQGREMHKSWGNAIEFNEAADRAGASVMRWMYMGTSPERNVNFGWNRLAEVERRLLTLWNVAAFFVTYAELDGWRPAMPAPAVAARPALDRWVLSELHRLIQVATDGMDRFDALTLVRRIESFVEDLSTWYVRRSRRRFWRATDKTDQAAAFATLYEVLVTLIKLIAPPMPFMAEELYQSLVRSVDSAAPESVHLCDWPTADAARLDPALSADMDLVRRVVSLGRAARSRAQIKVRQPVAALTVRVAATSDREVLTRHRNLLLEELNVKALRFAASSDEYVAYRVRPLPAVIGPQFGRQTQAILQALREADGRALARSKEAGDPVTVAVDGTAVELGPDSYAVEVEDQPGFSVVEEGGTMVALDTRLTPELELEGLARELVHRLQGVRRDAELTLSDWVTITLDTSDAALAAVVERHGAHIAGETIARSLTVGPLPSAAHVAELTFNGHHARVAIVRTD